MPFGGVCVFRARAAMASWTSLSTPSGVWERSLLQTSTTKEGLSKAAGEGPAYCFVLHGFSASASFLLDDSLACTVKDEYGGLETALLSCSKHSVACFPAGHADL